MRTGTPAPGRYDDRVRALLISTYDMGRQPFGLASAAAALRARGAEVRSADLSRVRLDDDDVRAADLVGFFLPMHTATRLAVPVIRRVRAMNAAARLCAFGLYAPLNATLLGELGVTIIAGGEFEDALAALAGGEAPAASTPAGVPRVTWRVPDRRGLLPLDRYARLHAGAGTRVVGYTEASRGCKHRCRHCPIVPVYDGRFRVVPPEVVLADVRAQVAAGARHVTFGDPDFFNGIRHAETIVRAFAREWPGVSYDVTIKIEHLLRHASSLPLLAETGCAFVTSAVEALDDDVLRRLEKGHTRADFEDALARCRAAGLPLAATFVAFTPWTTRTSYCAFLQALDRLGLAEQVAPIQLAIRLLVTARSRLLELPDVAALVERFDPQTLTHRWRHPDPAVDDLQARVAALVGRSGGQPRAALFDRIWELAHETAGLTPPPRSRPVLPARAAIPYLEEPWYC
jgi:radical SAM superfamily enzyme YgiQ (UPF0313 family)